MPSKRETSGTPAAEPASADATTIRAAVLRIDRLIEERIPLEAVDDALVAMRSGTGLRR